MTSPKEKSLQTLIKECDTVFSEYIRLLYADSFGIVMCCCGCGQGKPWRQMQASHWINRDNLATRYDTRNVVPATRECNYYDPNHSEKIGIFIETCLGGSEALELYNLGHSTMKFTRPELIEIRDTYKAKFKELKKQKGL